MRRRIIAPWLVVVGLTAAGLMTGAPASAAPIDKGHFIDAGSEDFSCDSVAPAIPTHHEFEARVNFVFNQRGGPNVFPYYRESVSGRDVLHQPGYRRNLFAEVHREQPRPQDRRQR